METRPPKQWKITHRRRASFIDGLLFFYVALAAHNRAFLFLHMTALALAVINIGQIQQLPACLVDMAGGAFPVLGRFIFQEFGAVIYMMADITLSYFSLFIVIIVKKNRFRPHSLAERAVLHGGDVILRKGANTGKQHHDGHHRQLYPQKPFHHRISPCYPQTATANPLFVLTRLADCASPFVFLKLT
jgi:hypothetical protein